MKTESDSPVAKPREGGRPSGEAAARPGPSSILRPRRGQSQFETWGVVIAALLAIVVLPLLNAETAATNPLHVSDFTINLYGKYLCYAILAIGVDILWGYTGLLSLGQSLFFSLGGYMMGMYLMRMIGDLGQYHKPIPDFLVFLGWDHLPSFWVPFASFTFALAMIVALPGTVAFVFGYLAFRSRIKGVYFSILTQALTYAACILFFRNDLLMGGNNGFTDFKFILGHDLREPGTQRGLYIATGIVLLAVYLVLRWLSTTKFGLVQRAIRDGENRVLFSGYASSQFKLFIFVLAAVIAAIGGALYVPQVGIINPSEMMPDKSLEAVVWVAVGGRGTLVGPILGAIGINALKSWATRAYPDLWLIFLGTLFILVVLFLPGGVVSLPAELRRLWRKFKTRRTPEEESPAAVAKPESLKG
ncbi:MAG TPA: urea ABC transporter permease subunit UrtC [Opitutaceae bacterium]|nr:urea ABC transporter permease subunit UrtC [Opitutaceae bacterium]